MEQLDFSHWPGDEGGRRDQKEEPVPFEQISCQYCEDVGLCVYCQRGREAIAEEKRKMPRKLPTAKARSSRKAA